MRRAVVVACLIATFAAAASITLRGQRSSVPTCDPDNGGLTLPPGLCALVIADNLGQARNLVVAPNGDIFVSIRRGEQQQGQPPQPGFLLGLRDTNGDGKIDVQEKFGANGATGIALRNGYLYYSTPVSIERFKMNPGELKPAGPAEVIVGGFPSGANQRGHADKDIAFDDKGNRPMPAPSPIVRRARRASIRVRNSKSTAGSGDSTPTRPDRRSLQRTALQPACGNPWRLRGTTETCTPR